MFVNIVTLEDILFLTITHGYVVALDSEDIGDSGEHSIGGE